MTEWKKICCAVDFGDPSRVALDQAAALAHRFEAELRLIHVVALPPSSADQALVTSSTLADVQVKQDEEMLARWRAEAEKRARRPVRTRLLTGDPATEILRDAREEHCDLVVVGTHGRTGVTRLVLGSVAERVARRSPCAVLVVHDSAELEKQEIAAEVAQYR